MTDGLGRDKKVDKDSTSFLLLFMSTDRVYYCSSPALDPNIAGKNVIRGRLVPYTYVPLSQRSIQKPFSSARILDDVQISSSIRPGEDQSTEAREADGDTRMSNGGTNERLIIKEEAGVNLSNSATTCSPPLAPSTSPMRSRLSPSVNSSPTPKRTSKSSTLGETLREAHSEAGDLMSPPAKRNWKSSGSSSPSGGRQGQKWEAQEDKLIWTAIVMNGEKGVDWHKITKDVNSLRDPEDARTLNAVKLHWSGPSGTKNRFFKQFAA